MIDPAIGRISRIAFFTDMTRAGAPVLPLGFMLEAAWPAQARWLGLIGRTRLTPFELAQVNLTTWPALRMPFGMLDQLFEQGWASEWGQASQSIQKTWSRSALTIMTDEYPLTTLSAETAEAWASTCDVLCTHLNALHVKLVPALVAEPMQIFQAPPVAVARPIDLRTRTGSPEAIAA